MKSIIVWTFGIIIILLLMFEMEGCRKSSYERVVGHPISWWDFIVISQK